MLSLSSNRNQLTVKIKNVLNNRKHMVRGERLWLHKNQQLKSDQPVREVNV